LRNQANNCSPTKIALGRGELRELLDLPDDLLLPIEGQADRRDGIREVVLRLAYRGDQVVIPDRDGDVLLTDGELAPRLGVQLLPTEYGPASQPSWIGIPRLTPFGCATATFWGSASANPWAYADAQRDDL
jgi:hypothetical protein